MIKNFEQWIKKHDISKYELRIINEHCRYPNKTLTELRGHKPKSNKQNIKFSSQFKSYNQWLKSKGYSNYEIRILNEYCGKKKIKKREIITVEQKEKIEYYDEIVIYGIARQEQNHDRYIPINISFCVVPNVVSEIEIQKYVNEFLKVRKLIPINPDENSYNIVGVRKVKKFMCEKIVDNEQEVFKYIIDHINLNDIKIYKGIHKKLKSTYISDWIAGE